MIKECPRVLVALTTCEKLYARFLRYLMNSNYHHALTFVKLPELGGWMAIDVDRDGPHLVNPRKAFKRITKFKCYYATENLFEGIKKCRDFMGSGYDAKGALSGIWLLVLKKFFGSRTKKPLQNPAKLFCLEYAALVLKYSNVSSFQDVTTSALTSSDVERLMDGDKTLRVYSITKEELING